VLECETDEWAQPLADVRTSEASNVKNNLRIGFLAFPE